MPPKEGTISLEETLEAAGSSDVILELAPTVATNVIDRWIETLTANPAVDDSEDMVFDLNTLKTQLSTSPIDGAAVSKTLKSLARETRSAAKDNDSEAAALLAQTLEESARKLSRAKRK